MVTKSIIKLIDEGIVPACALILGKMTGLFAASYFNNMSFTIQNAKILGFLPQISFTKLTDYVTAENYSNFAMFAAAALGTTIVLIRAHYFHESHIHPNLHAKLASLNLESLIAPSYHLYHQAAIWLIFLWLTTSFLLISTIILNLTYPIISAIAFLISANFTWVFAMDIEREIEINSEFT